MDEKLWKNGDLRSVEVALTECHLEEVSRLYIAKTGVGCDGFHPKVPLDSTKETRGEIVEFLDKAEQSGKWPQQTCTTMFFLVPKNVTSEGSIALMQHTLVRSLESAGGCEVAA